MKDKILKTIKDAQIEGLWCDTDSYDNQNRSIVQLGYHLELNGFIDFSIEERESDTDAWVEIHYYSKKLQKTIILDHEARTGFENIDDLVLYIENITKEMTELEGSIKLNNDDYNMLCEENKNMAKALSRLGYTPYEVSDICNGAI